jgi:hypothetical protein
MSKKTITLIADTITIDFACWFKWYGDRYETKAEAVKVWEDIVKTEGSKVKTQNQDNDYHILTAHYFDDWVKEAEERCDNQMCSASRADTRPTKNS